MRAPRFVIAIMCSVAAFAAMPYSEWYDKPRGLPHGVVDLVDSIAPEAVSAEIHARVAARDWSLRWGDRQGRYFQARLVSQPYYDTSVYAAQSHLTVSECVGDECREIISEDIPLAHNDYHSVKIYYDRYTGAVMQIGDEQVVYSAPVPFAAGAVGVAFESRGRWRYISVEQTAVPAADFSEFADVESLIAELEMADDPVEGVWHYLDRDMYAEKSTLGGKYSLATVRRGDAYDIVYLSGAEADSDEWAPLRVKGRMSPTPFAGVYDAEWVATDGRVLSDEVTAEINADATVLTIRIPMLQATMRFAKANDE